MNDLSKFTQQYHILHIIEEYQRTHATTLINTKKADEISFAGFMKTLLLTMFI